MNSQIGLIVSVFVALLVVAVAGFSLYRFIQVRGNAKVIRTESEQLQADAQRMANDATNRANAAKSAALEKKRRLLEQRDHKNRD